MEQQSGQTYGYSADFEYIDAALKARWESFSELALELDAFVPKTVEGFADHRQRELVRS